MAVSAISGSRKEKERVTVTKTLNRGMHAAKATKQAEFYTQLSDIEKEVRHYTKHFQDKTILCNCDDPAVSNFFHYFSHNFEKLKLKKLITTCYKNCDADLFSKNAAENGIYLEYDGDKNNNRIPDPDEIGIHKFKGDGDFRGEECVKLLKQADIVVTNPPLPVSTSRRCGHPYSAGRPGRRAWLARKGLREKSPWIGYLRVDPRVDGVRSHAQFDNLLRKAKLAR